MHRTEVKKEKWKCTEHKHLTGKISKNIIARHIKCLKQLNHTIIVPTVHKLISQVYSLWLLKWRESAGGELPLSVPSLPSRIFANPDGLATLSFNYRTILNVDWRLKCTTDRAQSQSSQKENGNMKGIIGRGWRREN